MNSQGLYADLDFLTSEMCESDTFYFLLSSTFIIILHFSCKNHTYIQLQFKYKNNDNNNNFLTPWDFLFYFSYPSFNFQGVYIHMCILLHSDHS